MNGHWFKAIPRAASYIKVAFPVSCSFTKIHRAPPTMVLRPVTTVAGGVKRPRDPNTLSNYYNFVTTHITANLEIDFEKKVLVGGVVLKFKSVSDAESDEIVLDSSFIDIKDIKVGGKTAKWSLADRIEPYGSPLTIKLGEKPALGKELEVDISLSTTNKCTALQWMTPEQTSNKKHPYMFSQCQAIHARSIFPCQDTPDVKATVEFNLRSPLPTLGSGLPTGSKEFKHSKDGKPATLLYTFKQDIPIPSYLFAVASGDLASASIGPRSTVWTGPEELQGCKWELEKDMEAFMEAAEKIVYPYAWTTYNVLILPSSFPYGGMENPVFTYATPTIISKDRQNVDVIAHELAHSWSGNLVSNASWEHFWLNEGWTTYLERRIQAEIHGEPHRDFSAIIGWKALSDSIEQFGEDHEYTKLVIDLKGKDPDDAFSSIPYEKGFTFLYYLEKLIGKAEFDRFIPHYFTTFKQKSLDSYDFKSCLLSFFSGEQYVAGKLNEVDWDKWFYEPGFPPKPVFDTSLADVCYVLAHKWEQRQKSGGTAFVPQASDIKGWFANQSVVFLEKVQGFDKPLSPEDAELLGTTYGYTTSQNVELVARFLVIGLKAKWKGSYKLTADLLGKVGRMKFVRPLYRCLNQCDHKLALATFEHNKTFYHPICRGLVEKDLAKA